MTSNVVDCLPAPKAVNDVRSRASAPRTGAGVRRPSYDADFWSRFPERVSRALTFCLGLDVTSLDVKKMQL